MSASATGSVLSDSSTAASARRTLVLACAGALMALLNFTLPLTTLPAISASLSATASDQTWILSGISLSVAALLLTSGSLADDYGRKLVFLVGLGLFVAASIVCAAAQDAPVFVVGRLVQGAGTAAVLASSLGLLARAFPAGPARTHATGLWGAMIGGGIALGPVIGALLAVWAWRSAYAALAVVSLVLLLYAMWGLEDSRAASPKRVDVLGVVTLGGGLVAVLAGLVRGNSQGWGSATTLALLGFGLAGLVAFVAVEATGREPMIDVRLFTRPAFVAAMLASACTGASVVAMMTYVPTFMQRALHIGIAGAAFVLLAWSATSFVAALQARRVASRLTPRAQLVLGLLLVAVGLGSLFGITVDSGWPRLVPGLLVSGVGTGLLNAGLARAAVDTVPPAQASMGSGANNMARYVGNGLGVAVLVAALHARALDIAQTLLAGQPGLRGGARGLAALITTGRLPAALQQTPPGSRGALTRIAAQAELGGMDVAVVIAVALGLLGALTAFVMLRAETTAPVFETPAPKEIRP
jgi:MFS family permease